jgi:hypothetical protein
MKDLIKALENGEAIKNYKIAGGTGDIIKEAYVGYIEDLNNFKESLECDLVGWTEWEDERTLVWHNGTFQRISVSYEDTLEEFGEDVAKELDKNNLPYIDIWFDVVAKDENGEDIYIYGIYDKWDWE